MLRMLQFLDELITRENFGEKNSVLIRRAGDTRKLYCGLWKDME